MRYRITLAISLFTFNAGSYATTLYQGKEQDIQRKISYTEKHNNQSRINRLNKTLSEVRVNYADSKLRANHQKKIAEQKNEIVERQRDLVETRQKGGADEVTKYEHKLTEAQQELKELETRDY